VVSEKSRILSLCLVKWGVKFDLVLRVIRAALTQEPTTGK